MNVLWWMIIAHAVCDYPLQGDFLARGKNHRDPIRGVPWYQCLLAHALIQGGGVALCSGSIILGSAEVACHAIIDYMKCAGWLSFNMDQSLHLACKILWALAILSGIK